MDHERLRNIAELKRTTARIKLATKNRLKSNEYECV